ncbi:TetR/AcrR family transcriptional regulator [Arcobacteraceae bacterium]|nr:TetR/AcrR family transcriptional regulator [Arcobacteraceae bacterium]
MAIIVDKVQKRRDIALSCNDLLLEKGIKKLTIAEVAKTAGVSKGSIYDYFENKEDIVFEIIRSHISAYQEEVNEKVNQDDTTREKVFLLFSFILNDDEEFEKHQNIYKEYMSIDIAGECENMCKFDNECAVFFKSILELFIQDGIKKGELIESSQNLVDGLLAVEKGFLVTKWTENKDVKQSFRIFLNTIFDLIEVKK